MSPFPMWDSKYQIFLGEDYESDGKVHCHMTHDFHHLRLSLKCVSLKQYKFSAETVLPLFHEIFTILHLNYHCN